MRYGEYDPQARRLAGQRRQARLDAAKAKGTHSKIEWKILHDIFGRCVACGVPYTELIGEGATKDHIMPLFCDGCDCLANLQPVCRQCNSNGMFGDMRFAALPGWQTIYLHKLGAYY